MKYKNHWSKTEKRVEVLLKINKGWKNLIPKTKTGKYIKCPQCGKEKYRSLSLIRQGVKYCSPKCSNASRKGKIPKNIEYARSRSQMQKGHEPFVKYGEDHWAYQKENPSYRAVHAWIVKKYGKAKQCENTKCVYPRKDRRGKMMIEPKSYQWANISGEYKRDRSDFKELCASCHKLFDLHKILL